MRRFLLLVLCMVFSVMHLRLRAQEQQTKTSGHYLFAWTGDAAHKGEDFLAVIDADPASKSYGELVATVATDQQTVPVHHTEYVMPPSGMLFTNDHDAGRTFIFDVRDPVHPKGRNFFYRQGRLYAPSLLNKWGEAGGSFGTGAVWQ